MLAGMLLAACGDTAPVPEPGADAAGKMAAPKVTDPGANMVAAVSAGKSAAAVGVHFSLGDSPSVNTVLPVEIAIIPHEAFESLGARFESQQGLTLVSGDRLAPATKVGAEQAIRHQLRLMPVSEGVFIVTATLETVGTEGTVTRVFSIPVIVAAKAAAGEPAAAPAEAPATPEPAEGAAPDS